MKVEQWMLSRAHGNLIMADRLPRVQRPKRLAKSDALKSDGRVSVTKFITSYLECNQSLEGPVNRRLKARSKVLFLLHETGSSPLI